MTLIRTVLIPRRKIILGDRLYWKSCCLQFLLCSVFFSSSRGRGCKILTCTEKGKTINLALVRESQNPETKLVTLWTKYFLSLACCSLVPLLKHPAEWSRILTAFLAIDTEFFVTHPTFFPFTLSGIEVLAQVNGRLPGDTTLTSVSVFSTHGITAYVEKEETCSCWAIHSVLVALCTAAVPAPGSALTCESPKEETMNWKNLCTAKGMGTCDASQGTGHSETRQEPRTLRFPHA